MLNVVVMLALAALKPPEVKEATAPVWPESEVRQGQDVEVSLVVSLDKAGHITATRITRSGGEAFDRAAVLAVDKWTFSPAERDGVAIDSRVVVPIVFEGRAPAASQPASQAASMGTLTPALSRVQERESEMESVRESERGSDDPRGQPFEVLPADPAADQHDLERPDLERSELSEPSFETSVHGHKQIAARAVSDFVLSRKVMDAAPLANQSAADLLTRAPGLYVARPEGDAVAHQLYLRGFDAEHGQDVELTVNRIPINQISHLHGQGYADLNFIIPELVRAVRVSEGVYDPRQGDFAVAGSADFDLGVQKRGYRSLTHVGSFGTLRQLALVAPPDEREETFVALAFRRSDGFGRNRGSLSGTLQAQYTFTAPMGFDGLLHVSGYGARASLAGVLRRDDVTSGRVGFYDSYPDATANAQSAFGGRGLISLHLERSREDGSLTFITAWVQAVTYSSQANFTGYTQRSQINPEWVGRGDLIEQRNLDSGLGMIASHRSSRWAPLDWLDLQLEVGANLRVHRVEQKQNLLQVPDNQTWDQRVDAQLGGFVVGGYVDLDTHVSKYVRVRGGLRADGLFFDIDDKLGNFIPSFQRQSFIVGFRRNASGVAVGPRVSVTGKPLSWLDVIASYGEGYRSPQARLLDNGESAPFTRVRSLEVGAKARFYAPVDLTLSAAAYATFLSDDLAFDPSEGSLDKIGPTSRKGFVLSAQVEPLSWLLVSGSVTYVNATLDAPPVATVTNPVPAYTKGQLLPYVPPWVARADVSARHSLFDIAEHAVNGRAGVGFSFLSPRPLPYGLLADPVALLDLSAALSYRWVELGLELLNVGNQKYAATEYNFVSQWQQNGAPSLVPARHFSAGAPLTIMGTLGVSL